MKVRLKREIVTLGVPDVSPTRMAGTYVKPDEWTPSSPTRPLSRSIAATTTRWRSAASPAANPHTRSFSELPARVEQASAPGGLLADRPRVAMFCTGGIRCEKSTAPMRMKGFDEVYHLEGGILKYLETIPEAE